MFKRAMVWNTKRNNFISWKIKCKHLTGFLWRSLQSRPSAEKRASYFLSKQRCSLLVGGCRGAPWHCDATEIPWHVHIVFLSQTVKILPFEAPIQLRMQTTRQATTKIFLLQETFNEQMRKGACINWLEKYNNYVSWNLYFLEEKV